MQQQVSKEQPLLKKKETKTLLPKSLKKVSDEAWSKILVTIRPLNMSIEALLRAARPIGFDGKHLTLGVFYQFHKERLEEDVHRRILEDVAEKVLGLPVRVKCMLTEPPQRKIKKRQEEEVVLTEGKDEDIIKVAEEIFSN